MAKITMARQAAIEEAAKEIKALSDILEKVVDGYKQSDAAKDLGVTAQKFSQDVANGFNRYVKRYISSEELCQIADELAGPEQVLLKDVLNLETVIEIPEFDYEVFYKEYLSILSDREKDIIFKKYGFSGDAPKTLEELSKEFGVTRERIRQIKERAFRRLRHPASLAVLFRDKELKEKMDELEKQVSEFRENCNKRLSMKIKDLETEKEMFEGKVLGPDSSFWMKDIRELDFSVRAYNCLVRNGFYTIGDLKKVKNTDELYRIRHMGQKSVEEIVAKMSMLGLVIH